MEPVVAALGLFPSGLDPSLPLPLQRQVFNQVRAAILQGRLAPGTRLPSTRALGRDLGVARNTVLYAFDQLQAEGYIESRPGSGIFVSRLLPETLLRAMAATQLRPPALPGDGTVSRRAELVRSGWKPTIHRGSYIPFATEPIAADRFPLELWARLCARHFRTAKPRDLGYGELAGYPPLRDAIARHLLESRGIRCTASQVMIVSGAQQALDLTFRVLLDPGDRVALEEPCYSGMRAALLAAGARPLPIPVDAEGIQVQHLASLRGAPRLTCVTPSHQYPLGVTLSLQRRLSLLAWAARRKTWVLEDDYDGDFRYSGRPLLAMQALDQAGRVIYVGTFSRTMLPSLRLGYLVLPPALVDAFTAMRALIDDAPPQLTQAAAAAFLLEGHFDRHLRRMRIIYAERRDALLEAASSQLKGLLELQPGEAGLQLIGWLADGLTEEAACEHAVRSGIDVRPLSPCRSMPGGRPGLLLGFAGFSPARLRSAVTKLAHALKAAGQGR
ncbi:PLP-dependent aminotransferase family protein [Paludibaculum fermentans]|uniref:MocR-like pyridoxine biosynthesis transcription factor PdxR n=1 Tax=Paludibaculum fermentans TaxID=1473598 RepID=UPI003EBF8375